MAEHDLNPNQLLSMQEDAIRRVREMQRRANQRLRQSNSHPPPDSTPSSPMIQPPIPSHSSTPSLADPSMGRALNHFSLFSDDASMGKSFDFNPLSILENIDAEKIIILLLIVIFLNEGGDIKLILALCYLLF